MHWNEAGEENRKALRGIVAMLLALADLAERASGRSAAVRCLVLWLLRPAEEVARDYVAEFVLNPNGLALSGPMAIRFDDDSAADAMRMALSFRTLAAALAALTFEAFAAWQAGTQALIVRLARTTGTLAALRDWPTAVKRRDSS